MKRNIFFVIFIVINFVLFSSCGRDPVQKIQDTLVVGEVIEEIINHAQESSSGSISEAIIDVVIHQDQEPTSRFIDNMSIVSTRSFNDDRAWVQKTGSAYSSGNWYLIDKEGQILFETEKYFTDFADGAAYHTDIGIIDMEGSLTFDNKEIGYKILGYGDGMFLVVKHVSDFNTNEWQFGAIDKNGDIIVPLSSIQFDEDRIRGKNLIDLRDDSTYSAEYLGGSVFLVSFYTGYDNDAIWLNIEKHKCILSVRESDIQNIAILTDFHDNFSIVAIGNQYSSDFDWRGYPAGIYRLGTDGEIINKITDLWIEKESLRGLYGGLVYIERRYMSWDSSPEWGDAFYNIYGEKVVDFPAYRGIRAYGLTPFFDGYALMRIQGADGLLYHTIIDINGNQLFEPSTKFKQTLIGDMEGKYFLVVWNDGEYPLSDTLNDFVVVWQEREYTLSDFIKNPQKKIFSVMDTGGDLVLSIICPFDFNLTSIEISCGMLKMPSFYINIQEKSILGTPDEEKYFVIWEDYTPKEIPKPVNPKAELPSNPSR